MKCIAPKLIWPHRCFEWLERHDDEERGMLVPCGKCLACLHNKRAEWIWRLEQEWRFGESAMFVTLTYDEKHLRSDKSLCKKDLQLFMKRLRKKHGSQRIRYYGVGEYGEVSGRPHYHVLLFNAVEALVRASWMDARGRSIGIVHVGHVSQASIAYCTKYIVQRPGVMEDGRESAFAVMSRGYGIGCRYLSDEMVKWHKDNEANYSRNNGCIGRLPRLFKDRIWYGEEREAIGKKALERALKEEQRRERFFKKKWGPKWHSKYLEMRDAMLAGIKEKVAYTQTL